MDCYYHNAVPSIARCSSCTKTICATCRNDAGDCPGCVLAARIDAAAAQKAMINGGVRASSPPPPQYEAAAPPPPPPYYPPQREYSRAVAETRPESRALVALGYPFWPLALIALFDPAKSEFVRRNAWQALGFNFGMYAIGWMMAAIAEIPFIGISAWPLLPFIIPVTIVASVIYGIKTWHGEEVSVPFVSEWVDTRLPHSRTQ